MGEKQKQPLWEKTFKAIANVPHNVWFGVTTGRHNIYGEKTEVSFIKSKLRENTWYSLPVHKEATNTYIWKRGGGFTIMRLNCLEENFSCQEKKKIPEGKEYIIVLSLAVSSEVQSKLKLWEKTILHSHLSRSWNHGFRLYDLKSWKPWSFQYNMTPPLHRWSTTVLMLIPYIYILFHSLERAFTFTPQQQPLWWQNHNTFTQLVLCKTLSHTVILQKRPKEVKEEEMAGKGPGQPGDSLQSVK